ASSAERESTNTLIPNWCNDGNRIGASAGGVAAIMCVSFPDRHADNAWERGRIYISSGFQAAVKRFDAHPIAGSDVELSGRMRVDFNRKPPHRAGDRIRKFLHPRQIRAASVVILQRKIRLEEKRKLFGRAGEN